MVFKIIALVLMAAFYACYYIKMFGQKKKRYQDLANRQRKDRLCEMG